MADISTELLGCSFASPVMTAAGPTGVDAAHCRRAVDGGASALVMKTISTAPAKVAKPCMARCGKDGILNCELWSELPAETYIDGEYARAKELGVPVIASIGYTAEQLADLGPRVEATGAIDAIEFSLHYTGAGYEPVIEAAKALRTSVSLPLLAKLSPGMSEIGPLSRALEPFVDGFVAVNSVGAALHLNEDTGAPLLGSKFGCGWLSGAPIRAIALRCVAETAAAVSKPVIGVGGIFSGTDAAAFLMAGASAVQICTAAILRGPGIYRTIADELDAWLDSHGYDSLDDCRGAYLAAVGKGIKPDVAGHPPHIDHARCVRCGLCVTSCPPAALTLGDNSRLACRDDLCVRCGLCLSTCPRNALS